jgi:hypothetical protein
VQFFLLILGALGVGHMAQWIKVRALLAVLLVCAAVVWVNAHVTYIPRWIQWNYSGFETKALWPQFSAVNDYLRGSHQDPRVVYEHDPRNRTTGSVRAFESLPLFSGRSTLEGLYIQSSIASPFVFYLQSEHSPKPSCPLTNYNYSRVNLKRGLEHLRIFNVSHYIAVTDDVRTAIEKCPDVIREKDFPPYTIYRLTSNPDRYVSLLHHEPPLVITDNWRGIAFEWFRRGDLTTHLALKEKLEPSDARLFTLIVNDQLPEGTTLNRPSTKNTIAEKDSSIREIIRPEEIIIETPYTGRPHLVRISYHPNWHVEGAERIYLVSPSFMLIYPTQKKVRLYFGRSLPNYIGYLLSIIGIVIIFMGIGPFRNLGIIRYSLSVIRNFKYAVSRSSFASRLSQFPYKKQLLWGISLIIVTVLMATILIVDHRDPTQIYNRGMDSFKKGNYAKARAFFKEGMRSFPLSPIIDQTAFHFAITYFKENNWQKALDAFEKMARDYPECRNLSEVLYHIGLCRLKLERREEAIRVFQQVIEAFPEDKWADYSRERLRELGLLIG